MTALLAREIAVAPAHYVVEHPRTGEVLGYLTLAPEWCSEPLRRALEQHGFRLVVPGEAINMSAGAALVL